MKSAAIRKFIYIVVFIVSLAFLLLSVYQIYVHTDMFNNFLKNTYKENKNVLNIIKKLEKDVLTSVAISISQNNTLKNLIKKDDRDKGFKLVKNIWDEYRKKLGINEIHIVDKNGHSFVNFVDFNAGIIEEKDRYIILPFRKDIEKSMKTEKSVSTLFVCRYFVGFRSVYPIKDGNELIGAVSVGKSIEKVVPEIKKSLNKNSFAVIYVDKVKGCLKEERLKALKSRSRNKHYIILGTVDNFRAVLKDFDFQEGFLVKRYKQRTYLFSTFPLRDLRGETVGYIVFQDDISFARYSFIKSIVNIFFTYAILLAGIVGSILFFSRKFERRLSEIEDITERLSNKDFSVLEKYKIEDKGDDLEKLKENILTMGKELHNYIIELNRQMLKLSEENYKDPLLEILNRRALVRVGNTEIEKAKIRGIPFSVIVLDLDNFKQINDRYGHNAGDEVLKDFVEVVKNVISSRDLFFRLGGEEFLIMLPGADREKAVEIGEQIRREVEKRYVEIGGKKIRYTVSIGVAQMGENDDIYSVISKADDNLYQAKREGRNKVVG